MKIAFFTSLLWQTQLSVEMVWKDRNLTIFKIVDVLFISFSYQRNTQKKITEMKNSDFFSLFFRFKSARLSQNVCFVTLLFLARKPNK